MSLDASSLTDHELVARLVSGDEAALALLYDRHGDLVYGAVLRFLGDRQVAEEVVQDAFLAIWRGAGRYDPAAGTVPGWLLRIARNRAIDRRRAAARRPSLVTFGGPGGGDEEAAAGPPANPSRGASFPSPEEVVARDWSRAVVRSALAAMPEGERRALELAYDEELTQVEIAVRLGWPLGTVKSRTRRALASLRTVLEGVPGLLDRSELGDLVPLMTAPANPPAGGRDAAR